MYVHLLFRENVKAVIINYIYDYIILPSGGVFFVLFFQKEKINS